MEQEVEQMNGIQVDGSALRLNVEGRRFTLASCIFYFERILCDC